jgi:hypothetical protein
MWSVYTPSLKGSRPHKPRRAAPTSAGFFLMRGRGSRAETQKTALVRVEAVAGGGASPPPLCLRAADVRARSFARGKFCAE